MEMFRLIFGQDIDEEQEELKSFMGLEHLCGCSKSIIFLRVYSQRFFTVCSANPSTPEPTLAAETSKGVPVLG